LIPPYFRKEKTKEELVPWLYLKGISTGDFSEALRGPWQTKMLPPASGISDSTISRLWGSQEAGKTFPVNDTISGSMARRTVKRKSSPLRAASGKK